MAEDRPYWNMEMESALNTPEVKKIQLEKLKKMLKRIYQAKPFWKERMDKAGGKPEDIKTLEDFSQRIPIMDKGQRRQILENCEMDMVRLIDMTIGVPIEDVRLIAATSGTTGYPTPYPITTGDIEWLSEFMARVQWRMGIRPGDRIIHAFGLSMFLAGTPYVVFSQKLGASVLPVGAEAGAEKVLSYTKMFRADTLGATPSLVEHLIERAPEIIGGGVDSLEVKRLFCAGEPGAGIPEVRQRLESAYGAKVYDHGAGFGISCDYPEYQGMHHVMDDMVYFELIDPETEELIPMENGARGVPVQTSLMGEGMLWVRESLGDVAEVYTDPCPCGQTGFRYKIVGRTDDMLKIKGAMVYPAAIDGVISSFVPRVTGEFRIVLNEPPPRVVPPLKLKVERGQGVEEHELAALTQEIVTAMQTKQKFRPEIEWLPPNTLERFAHKTKFIEKAYES